MTMNSVGQNRGHIIRLPVPCFGPTHICRLTPRGPENGQFPLIYENLELSRIYMTSCQDFGKPDMLCESKVYSSGHVQRPNFYFRIFLSVANFGTQWVKHSVLQSRAV